jgi:hypothetical protein
VPVFQAYRARVSGISCPCFSHIVSCRAARSICPNGSDCLPGRARCLCWPAHIWVRALTKSPVWRHARGRVVLPGLSPKQAKIKHRAGECSPALVCGKGYSSGSSGSLASPSMRASFSPGRFCRTRTRSTPVRASTETGSWEMMSVTSRVILEVPAPPSRSGPAGRPRPRRPAVRPR